MGSRERHSIFIMRNAGNIIPPYGAISGGEAGTIEYAVSVLGVREIVMGTNPTLEGDGTALYISNLLADDGVKITRLARGIASGSVLEFANREMLADALRGRQEF